MCYTCTTPYHKSSGKNNASEAIPHPESLDEYPLTKLKFVEVHSKLFWLETLFCDVVPDTGRVELSIVFSGTSFWGTRDFTNLEFSVDVDTGSDSLLQGFLKDKEGSVDDVSEDVLEEKDSAERLLFPGPWSGRNNLNSGNKSYIIKFVIVSFLTM